jgi:bacteriocin-like protein
MSNNFDSDDSESIIELTEDELDEISGGGRRSSRRSRSRKRSKSFFQHIEIMAFSASFESFSEGGIPSLQEALSRFLSKNHRV